MVKFRWLFAAWLAVAFAAAFGWGVAASVITVLTVQGSLTVLGAVLGDVLPQAQLAAVTATGAGAGQRWTTTSMWPVSSRIGSGSGAGPRSTSVSLCAPQPWS